MENSPDSVSRIQIDIRYHPRTVKVCHTWESWNNQLCGPGHHLDVETKMLRNRAEQVRVIPGPPLPCGQVIFLHVVFCFSENMFLTCCGWMISQWWKHPLVVMEARFGSRDGLKRPLVPPVISSHHPFLIGIFHEINHPAMGYPQIYGNYGVLIISIDSLETMCCSLA